MIEEYFTKTYKEFKWHMGTGESRSGIGSSLKYTESVRQELPKIIDRLGVNSIFDCSCGDWNWMKHISSKFHRYVGNDVVEEMVDNNTTLYGNERISFVQGDMLTSMKKYSDKEFDLLLCRHTLEHLPVDYIKDALNEMKRISKYALITSTDLFKTKSHQDDADNQFRFDGVSYRPINLEVGLYLSTLGTPSEKIKEFSDSKTCYLNLYKFH